MSARYIPKAASIRERLRSVRSIGLISITIILSYQNPSSEFLGNCAINGIERLSGTTVVVNRNIMNARL
jgi:hypothetical protein